MNISASAISECDGQVDDDRPEYVEELTLQRTIGWKVGSPAVGDPIKLSDNPHKCYSHYRRGDQLFQPDADSFLSELFDCDLITSLEDVSKELNTDQSTLQKACDLHGIDLPESQSSDPHEPDGDTLVLPSGELWPKELLADPIESDTRVLSQLLATDGMSVEEVSTYLSDRLSQNVTERDVRQEAQKAKIL